MLREVVLFRFGDAFCVERPLRGRYEPVTVIVHNSEACLANGRYQTESGTGSCGQMFFGWNEANDPHCNYHQVPLGGPCPLGSFVSIQGAVVCRDWQEYLDVVEM